MSVEVCSFLSQIVTHQGSLLAMANKVENLHIFIHIKKYYIIDSIGKLNVYKLGNRCFA